ncbi:unnamed protein product (macronuclear) [Paramecium tetraurelia]|uniref:Transmembrane protein n=1 Tax=Paramecium tetraurelia TaxID=5888 RepID=A0BT97_PARTE|nr:uncharacterized protein GSPATT00031996001 [Paramecium tetraurelia]CAK61764.1 unnamed protein product [Paramecium tetraurelia]|eukprot:XP_001429162.1 hypothetical protein (macronuclear) [Paramecium tetraurelia strain d4-2]
MKKDLVYSHFYYLKIKKKEAQSKKITNQGNQMLQENNYIKSESKLELTTQNRDAKVNSQKFDEQILINPEQIKYEYYFLANFQKEKIILVTLKKNSGQQLQNMAGQFSYLICGRNQQNKQESTKQAHPTAMTESRVYKFNKNIRISIWQVQLELRSQKYFGKVNLFTKIGLLEQMSRLQIFQNRLLSFLGILHCGISQMIIIGAYQEDSTKFLNCQTKKQLHLQSR